jgi:hypothetical protein
MINTISRMTTRVPTPIYMNPLFPRDFEMKLREASSHARALGFGGQKLGKNSARPREVDMPPKSPNVKNKKQYEALKDKGMSKERAAKIANSPGASKRGGKRSGSGGSAKQGGTTAQHKAAGRKGGNATARKGS